MFHEGVHDKPTLNPFMNHLNPPHMFNPCSCYISVNMTLTNPFRAPKWKARFEYNEMPVLAEQREHPKTADVKIRGWQRFFLERDEIRLRYIMYNFTQKDDKSKCVLFFSREQWNIILFISIEFGFHKGKLNISLFMELENCNQRIWSQSWDYLSYMEDTVVTNGRWLLKISWRIPPTAELVFVPPLRKLAEFLGRCPEWIQCQRSNIGNSVKIPFSDEAPHTRLQRIIVEKK